MALSVSIYRLADGVFTGRRFSGPERYLKLGPGEGAIEGAYDSATARVDLVTGQVVRMTPADDREGAGVSVERMWAPVRRHRNHLLAASDVVVVRAYESQQPVPQVWIDYRQALRDIPEHPDPESIVWPQPPADC